MAVHALTMRLVMPGQWPLETRAVDDDVPPNKISSMVEPSHQNRNVSQWSGKTQGSLQIPRTSTAGATLFNDQPPPPNRSPSLQDELFFDCSEPQTPTIDDETASSYYLAFEPVAETDLDIVNLDWRRYDPPTELFRPQEGISDELSTILAPSIERIQVRHRDEQEQRAAASRVERPLARAARASVKPRRQALVDTTHLTPLSRLSANSETSLSSTDPGYGSMSLGTEPSRSPRSAARRSFGLSGLFKRKDRTIVNLEELANNLLPAPRSTENWPLPQTLITSLSSPATDAPSQSTQTTECVSCLEDFAKGELVKLSCHSYCKDCFQRLIANALESETHWPPKCCLNTIATPLILPHLAPTTTTKYIQRESEWSIPAGDRIYCSHPNCGSWIPPIRRLSPAQISKCPSCHKTTCLFCRGPSHSAADCPQDPALAATISLAETEGWKRCYSCRALVEHNKGCRHMTCRCRAQFCYICGLKWKTCACTDAQLATIQQNAEIGRAERAEATRREEVRTTRQRRERDEEMAAIVAVEAFVRAEEERVARELEEVRRVEEERRRAAEQERIRREEARVAAVNARFRRLAGEMDMLHDVQRVWLAERNYAENEVSEGKHQEILAGLILLHASDQAFLANESSSKISDLEAEYEAEYTVRLAEERRIEEAYVVELRAYWTGKLDGANRIREAKDDLRADRDKDYAFWDNWRKTQVEDLREGERRKMEGLRVRHEAEVKTATGRAKLEEVEGKRKKWAEGRWVEEVVRERLTILGEMEVQEYGREV